MNRRSLLLGSLVAGAAGLFGVKAKPVEPDYESAGKAMAWLDKQRMSWETIYPSFEQEADELRLQDDITWATVADTNTDVTLAEWKYEKLAPFAEIRTQITRDMIHNSPEYRQLLINRIRENMVDYYGAMQEKVTGPSAGFVINQELPYPRPYDYDIVLDGKGFYLGG